MQRTRVDKTLETPLTGGRIWLVEQRYMPAVCCSQGQASEQPERRGSRSNPAGMDTWHVAEAGPRQGARSVINSAGIGKHLCKKLMLVPASYQTQNQFLGLGR